MQLRFLDSTDKCRYFVVRMSHSLIDMGNMESTEIIIGNYWKSRGWSKNPPTKFMRVSNFSVIRKELRYHSSGRLDFRAGKFCKDEQEYFWNIFGDFWKSNWRRMLEKKLFRIIHKSFWKQMSRKWDCDISQRILWRRRVTCGGLSANVNEEGRVSWEKWASHKIWNFEIFSKKRYDYPGKIMTVFCRNRRICAALDRKVDETSS